MPMINRSLINEDNDTDHYKALVARQNMADKNSDTLREYNSIPTGFTVEVQ